MGWAGKGTRGEGSTKPRVGSDSPDIVLQTRSFMSRYGLALGAAALALFVAPGGAMATSMLYQDLSALTQSSDAVVQGTGTKTESRWSGDTKRIVTHVPFDVSAVLK